MTAIDRHLSLARLVLDHPECAHVLRSHHLDYCCRGALTVAEACAGKGVDAAALIDDLAATVSDDAERPSRDPRGLTTPEIVADLRAGHRRFLERATLTVAPLLAKVAREHGGERPKLRELADVFGDLVCGLQPHIDEEELVLFPELLACTSTPSQIARELGAIRREHLVLGEQLTRMRSLTDDFAVPTRTCGSFRALMEELSSLDDDLCRHVHVENHVLLPRFVRRDDAFWSYDGGAPIALM